MAGIIGVVAIVIAVQLLLETNQSYLALGLAACSLTLVLAWLVFIRPKLDLFDEGLLIVNPYNSIAASWDQVEEIDTRFGFNVTIGGKRYHAWAAPSPSRYQARYLHQSDFRGLDIETAGGVRHTDSPKSHSGSAAYLARDRKAKFRGGESYRRVQLNLAGLTLTVACAAATLLSF